MSDMYRKISLYYKKGWWSKTMVAEAVQKQLITAEEYKKITGEDYPGDENE